MVVNINGIDYKISITRDEDQDWLIQFRSLDGYFFNEVTYCKSKLISAGEFIEAIAFIQENPSIDKFIKG